MTSLVERITSTENNNSDQVKKYMRDENKGSYLTGLFFSGSVSITGLFLVAASEYLANANLISKQAEDISLSAGVALVFSSLPIGCAALYGIANDAFFKSPKTKKLLQDNIEIIKEYEPLFRDNVPSEPRNFEEYDALQKLKSKNRNKSDYDLLQKIRFTKEIKRFTSIP